VEGLQLAAQNVGSELGGITNGTMQTVQSVRGELDDFANQSVSARSSLNRTTPTTASQDAMTTTTSASVVQGSADQSPWSGLQHAAASVGNQLGGVTNQTGLSMDRLEPFTHAAQGVEGQLDNLNHKTKGILTASAGAALQEGLDVVGVLSNSTHALKSQGLSLQLRHALTDVGITVDNLHQQANDLRKEISSFSSDQSCSLDGLFFDKVLHSNLGNHGPDTGEPSLILESNRTHNGLSMKRLEFKVFANSPYIPGLPAYNGITHGLVGRYGTIVVVPGNEVNFTFRTFDLETGEPVQMPSIAYTFFDLDEYTGHTASEFIKARGFTHAETTADSEVVRTVNADGTTTFQASTEGTFDDNPVDPMLLTEEQRNRAVTLHYTNTDQVSVVIGASAGSSAARAFTFVAHPVLQCAKTIGPSGSAMPKQDQGNESIMLKLHRLLPVLLGGLFVLAMIACLSAVFFVCC
jgi:hypothetical protein